MKSVDTNLLVRVIVVDDPVQVALAQTILARPVFVTDGVLMETEWVLRSRYRMSRHQIAEALFRLLDVGSLSVAQPELVAWSLERYAAGADFADMLHLSASRYHEAFVTFEKDLADYAGPDAPVPIERLQ